MHCEYCKRDISHAARHLCDAMPRADGHDGPGGVVRADMVNHPPHYTAGKVECIDALEAATTGLAGIDAVCTASAIKYLWRWKQKGGKQDLEKARWYINRLLEVQS